MKFKAELIFKDRVGIVADISALVARQGLSIFSMEVVRKADKAFIYLATDDHGVTVNPQKILDIIGRIPDLIDSRLIDTLPQEERENRFRVVLDNVSDGVVSIGRNGCVTTINRMALRALNRQGQDVLGRQIGALGLPPPTILDCLQGRTFNNVKKDLITEKGRFQFFATGRPIKDSEGQVIGAVEIAKDVQEIKALAKSFTEPGEVVFGDIVGRHPAITAAILFAQKIAGTDSIVAIRGASGTGKELFARAIHSASGRKGSFVPVNCAALPEQLLESELFGYSRGAFTGSRKEGKPGLFEIAQHGTLFLDEIAEMPPRCQAKILRVIQDKRIRRIGGASEIKVDTRIISATNRNLENRVARKRFREDLYYRISVLPLHIPPLKERSDDIPLLVDHFLFQLAARLGNPTPVLSSDGMNKLLGHDWPGNVRELKNVVERAAILSDGRSIDAGHVIFSHEVGSKIGSDACLHADERSANRSLKERLAVYEIQIVSDALAASKSIREAARRLGLSHTSLLNKLKKHGIEMETKRTIVKKTNRH